MASSLRSFSREDVPAVLELSRRAFNRPEEQVGNPLWASRDELESELSDWDEAPETTLLVDEEDGLVVGFGVALDAATSRVHQRTVLVRVGPNLSRRADGLRHVLVATIRLTAR